MNTVLLVLPLLSTAVDPVPEAKDVQPGWIALVTVLSLVVATTLLWLSMRKQLKRIQVPREGEEQDATEPKPGVTTPGDESR